MQVMPPTMAAVPDLYGTQSSDAKTMAPEHVEHVATQFEAVFMSMLTKQMRESLEDGMFGGENSDTYGALFDLYLGQHMAEAGGVGLKKMLVSRYAEASSGVKQE